MENKFEPEFHFSRHSTKPTKDDPESVDYRGINEGGVELAKERAKEIAELIESSSEGSILYSGGVSGESRARSTLEVYNSELKNKFVGRSDIIFISSDEISDLALKKGYSSIVESIVKRVENNDKAKVIIDFPLFIKQLWETDWFLEKDQLDKPGIYLQHLQKRIKDENIPPLEMLRVWFEEGGKINGKQVGPNPEDVARKHIEGMKRLGDFIKKYFPKRPIKICLVGHSDGLDATLVYLKGNGHIDAEKYAELGGYIKETEAVEFILKEDEIVANYRGFSFPFKLNKENE